MTPRIYFTVVPTTRCGFTDQLNQFAAFYRLGCSLGYEYLHTPFFNHRSSANVYHLLGLDDLFAQFSQLPAFTAAAGHIGALDVNLTAQVLEVNQINDLDHLQAYVRSLVSGTISQTASDAVLVTFVSPQQERSAVFLINARPPALANDVDYYAAYKRARGQRADCARDSNHASASVDCGRLTLLAHIRQGDTAVMRTPWNTYLPLWKARFSNTTYSDRTDEAFLQIIEPAEYYEFLRVFMRDLADRTCACLVCSDGYAKGVEVVLDNVLTKMHITHRAKSGIRRTLMSCVTWLYNRLQFRSFKSLPRTTLAIGESDRNLMSLIDAALSADIVVVGTQQVMIPKLLNLFDNNERQPIVITLYKTREKPDYSYFESRPGRAHMLFFNLLRGDHRELAAEVSSALASRLRQR